MWFVVCEKGSVQALAELVVFSEPFEQPCYILRYITLLARP